MPVGGFVWVKDAITPEFIMEYDADIPEKIQTITLSALSIWILMRGCCQIFGCKGDHRLSLISLTTLTSVIGPQMLWTKPYSSY